ncbi:MAG TPA: hypothetical protein VEC99_12700 [Clostridia bacterium]|nr:hypothetical protein [Clostridia bacterium]
MKPLLLALLLCADTIHAQLAVTVSPVKATGQKAIVPLALRNNLGEKIESARAACFILDDQGKVVGQASRWIIGGSGDKAGLTPGATNSFHFVITSDKPFATTNLAARVQFSRVILEGDKLANVQKDVQVENSNK